MFYCYNIFNLVPKTPFLNNLYQILSKSKYERGPGGSMSQGARWLNELGRWI